MLIKISFPGKPGYWVLSLFVMFCAIINNAYAQAGNTVTGIVRNDKDLAFTGAYVTLANNNSTLTACTYTDSEGIFRFDNVVGEGQYVLVVSADGYEPSQTIYSLSHGEILSLNLKLHKNLSAWLSDVVVIGYGTVQRKNLVGSVSSIGMQEIQSRPVANALEAMQGKIAGIDVIADERPGEIGNVRIRGARSLSASNAPLYVLDGIPLTAGGMESINPNDIESIDVLKDATSTAIYGSRGANGVIMVTTKRGRAGRTNITYYGKTTIEDLTNRTKMMDAAQYIEFRRDAYRRITYNNQFLKDTLNGGYPLGAPSQAEDIKLFGPDKYALANVMQGWQNGSWDGSKVTTTDWESMVTRTGVTQDHTLSISSGTEKVKTYMSFGYLGQQGTQLGQDHNRYSGKINIEVKPVKWFKAGGDIAGTYKIQNYGFSSSAATGPGSLYAVTMGMLPFTVPYDSAGNRIDHPGADVNIISPLGEEQYNVNVRKILRTFGAFYAELSPVKGLRYRFNFGPDFNNYYNGKWMDAKSINRGGGEPGATNYAQLNQNTNFAYTLDNLLYYDKSVGKHLLGITLLQSATYNKLEASSMTASNMPVENHLWYQMASVDRLDDFSTSLRETALSSYMARVSYSFGNRYLLTASTRWDGSSVFADGHRWGFFPSLGLGWRIDQETFMHKVSWIDQLKLRVGVGSTGNAAVTPYTTKGGLQALYYAWGNTVQPGYVPSDPSLADPLPMPNVMLGWEKTTQWNAGLDFSLIKGRVNGALDVFTARTTDLLLKQKIPSVLGYPYSFNNIGATTSKGLELSLNTRNITTRKFNWSSTLTVTASKTGIAELSNGKADDLNNLWFIGQQLSVYYDYEKVGIWQNTAADWAELNKYRDVAGTETYPFKPGDIKVKDLNGDYKIDPNNDRKVIGHTNPDLVLGLVNTFAYGNFDLQIFLYSRWGYTIKTSTELLQGRFALRQLNYWTPTNPTNDYPAPNRIAEDPYASAATYFSGNFIKIRNIALGYRISPELCKKIKFSNIKIYVQLLNPGFVYSSINWIDADVNGPVYNKGYVLGVNLGI